jgi:transposase
MFVKKTVNSHGTYLQLAESYYDHGVSRQKIIRPLGYLEDLRKKYDDPIDHFTQEARRLTAEKKKELTDSLTIDLSADLGKDESSFRNVGYVILKEIYRELDISTFWHRKADGLNIKFDLDQIFQLLVFSRALYPASKKCTYENRDIYFEKFDFSLNDVYRALDIFAKEEKSLQAWIYSHSKEQYLRDISCTYFDCTNYYFEIEQNDDDLIDEEGNIIEKGFRKRGPEKNHRSDPIIEMGLLMDSSGIPVSYDLFPGNESEKLHLRPAINRARTDFGIGRTIIVADRGLNTSDNIFYLNGDNKGDANVRDGYVYGQSVRGADAEFKEWVLKEDYIRTEIREDDENVIFTHKSRIYPKTIYITRETRSGTRKQKITADQKQMVYYSEKYARKQAAARSEMIARAEDLIAHPKKYDRITAAGATGYVLNLSFNKSTGEIVDKDLQLDIARIREEEKYDGYYSIVTSELDLSDPEIRRIYRGLARIEDTFKVSKSTLESRPVWVWTKESIEAHFMTCFTALVMIRLLEKRTQEKYAPDRLLHSLVNYGCISLGSNKYQFTYFDEILAACSQAFHLDLQKKYRTRRDLRALLKY